MPVICNDRFLQGGPFSHVSSGTQHERLWRIQRTDERDGRQSFGGEIIDTFPKICLYDINFLITYFYNIEIIHKYYDSWLHLAVFSLGENRDV